MKPKWRGRLSWAAILAITAGGLHAAEPRTVAALGLKLMPIPAGSFAMGSPAAESTRNDNESPVTKVIISRPFWLGECEVTQAQWRAVMGTDLVEQARRMLADDNLYTLGGKPQALRSRLDVEQDTNPRSLIPAFARRR